LDLWTPHEQVGLAHKLLGPTLLIKFKLYSIFKPLIRILAHHIFFKCLNI